jgi:chemotaxis protein methyltransferase CheR
MERALFETFRKVVYDNSGIALGDGKEALVTARVAKRMRTLGIDTHKAYLDFLLADRSGEEVVHFLDVISTNVTSFFREPEHFEFLTTVTREWLAQGQRRMRIWSAASSTGEEPYTLAIALKEAGCGQDVDLKILATDISTQVLNKCELGLYGEEKLKTMPRHLVDKWFDKLRGEDEGLYRVKDSLKKCITFTRLNLSTPPFPMRGPFDVIFCRNVMIYFDNTVRRNLLQEAYRLLKTGGYLLVGHAESLTGMMSELRPVRPSIYVKS